MFEKDLPDGKTAEFNKNSEIGDLPLETCETINQSWGYNKNDSSYKSEKELLHYLIRAAGHNGNFLLNIGPLPTGKIQPEFITQLKAMRQWMVKYDDSIYGTRGGPVAPRPWGVTTQKGNKIYFHILDWQDALLPLPNIHGIIRSAKFLNNGRKADIIDTGQGLVLSIPERTLDRIDTILVLEM